MRRDVGCNVQIDLHRPGTRIGFVFQSTNGLLHQTAVHFVADRGDVSALLAPQKIPRPANLQITHGDAEAGAQLAELLDRFEAFGRLTGRRTIGRKQQITVRPMTRPPDASA